MNSEENNKDVSTETLTDEQMEDVTGGTWNDDDSDTTERKRKRIRVLR